MSIRKTLMIGFLLVSLLPAALLAMLAFRFASDSLRSEIERSLQVEAATVSQDIDKALFERLQNAKTWSQLEVMQDIQVGDVDKQLSKFLGDTHAGYRGVYSELLCVDDEGMIVASSDSASIGALLSRAQPDLLFATDDGSIRVEALRTERGRGPVLPIDADVPSRFKPGTVGRLRLLFDWSQVDRILDQAAQGGRLLMLVDRAGRIIATSSALRRRHYLSRTIPQDWLDTGPNGVASRDGAFLREPRLTFGFNRSRWSGSTSPEPWTTVVIQPTEQALAPVRRMATYFGILLVLASSLAIAFSLWIASRIASPIAQLTRLTREFARTGNLGDAPANSPGEVGELIEAFVQTIRELERSRNDLVRASKLAALGEMSAVMAHEIRTPIGILRSSAQMLSREAGLGDDARELTRYIDSETKRLNDLVSTLLDSTRLRPPVIRAVDLHELIDFCAGAFAGVARDKGIRVETFVQLQDPVVQCDPDQLKQVVLNLLQNALQLVPPHGRVSIRCRRSGKAVLVEVADDGPGIPDEVLPRLFEPFFTRREGGIGLGLFAVQHIVKAHHGEIEAGTSDLGGASLTFTIPAAGAPA